MNNFLSEKCKLVASDLFGRYIVAAKDIKAGEILLIETPTVVGPYWDTIKCCLNCYEQFSIICKNCKQAPICKKCTTQPPDHDQFECDFLKQLNLPNKYFLDHLDIITPLRLLILSKNENRKSIYQDLIEMESHCPERKNTDIWKLHEKLVIGPMKRIGLILSEEDEALVHKFCGILDVNSFEVRTPNFLNIPVRGIYIKAALFAHHCIGNIFVSVDKAKTMRVYASEAIKAGETIYNNYTNSLAGTIIRREHLLEGKYFHCQCTRCTDPTELGTNFSSIKCKLCSQLGKSEALILCHERISSWQCNNCEKQYKSEEINFQLSMATNDLSEAAMDIRKLEKCIERYEEILNKNHYLIIEMKQRLIAILRNVYEEMSFSKYEENLRKLADILERKVSLCEDIIPILRIFQPGISRLTAIALYEHFDSVFELLKIQFKCGEINRDEFMKKLNLAEQIGKESISMLVYEPPDTPEGHLTKRALSKLKELRNTVLE